MDIGSSNKWTHSVNEPQNVDEILLVMSNEGSCPKMTDHHAFAMLLLIEAGFDQRTIEIPAIGYQWNSTSLNNFEQLAGLCSTSWASKKLLEPTKYVGFIGTPLRGQWLIHMLPM